MFFKVLAFGLAALTLVRAAPSFHAASVSCSINLDTSQSVASTEVKTLNNITPGLYRIWSVVNPNLALSRDRAAGVPGPIAVLPLRENPFALWTVTADASSPGTYKIDNPLGGATYVGSDNKIMIRGSRAQSFVIYAAPGQQDTYYISVPGEDKLWTTSLGSQEVVVTGWNGQPGQLWRFELKSAA